MVNLANMCAITIQVEFGSFEQAEKLEQDLNVMLERNDNGSGFLKLDQMSLGHVYVRRCNHEITIEGEVKWGTNDDEMKSLLHWFQARADVCTFEVTYEEPGCGLFGTYSYDDMEPDVLLNVYVPQEKWPADYDRDDWFDKLYNLLETDSEDRQIDLKTGGDNADI